MKTSTAVAYSQLLRKIAREKHEQKLHAWLCEKIMPHGLRKASAGILTIIISEAPEIPFN